MLFGSIIYDKRYNMLKIIYVALTCSVLQRFAI